MVHSFRPSFVTSTFPSETTQSSQVWISKAPFRKTTVYRLHVVSSSWSLVMAPGLFYHWTCTSCLCLSWPSLMSAAVTCWLLTHIPHLSSYCLRDTIFWITKTYTVAISLCARKLNLSLWALFVCSSVRGTESDSFQWVLLRFKFTGRRKYKKVEHTVLYSTFFLQCTFKEKWPDELFTCVYECADGQQSRALKPVLSETDWCEQIGLQCL